MAVVMSQEELTYLLRLLGRREMLGTELDIAQGDVRLESVLLGAAERTLRARGWIVPTGDVLNIEQTVLGTVSFCANAPYTLAVRRTPVNGVSFGKTFHISTALQITHTGRDGIHRFDVLETSPVDAVLEAMYGNETVYDTERAPLEGIPAQAMVTAAVVAQDEGLSDDQAVAGLTELGMDGAQAGDLLRLYRDDWIATVLLGAWSPGDESFEYAQLSFLQGRGGWWIITPGAQEPLVDLRPISADALAGMIDQTVQTALSER